MRGQIFFIVQKFTHIDNVDHSTPSPSFIDLKYSIDEIEIFEK